jgi:hypothetical protein
MSQQAAAGRGAGRGGGRKSKFIPQEGGVESLSKAFRSSTLGIKKWTFNTGQNKFAAQFTLSRKEVANYIQRTLADKGYLVAEMIRSREKQSILLPAPVDPNNPDKSDLEAIRVEDVKTVAKRRQKLRESHCFNCGSPSHWTYECPQLVGEQQAQLHMNLDEQEEGAEGQAVKEGHQLMHVSLSQGGELPDDQAYLDGCSTVTAFKNGKFMSNIHSVQEGIKINCNAGTVTTNKKGRIGGVFIVLWLNAFPIKSGTSGTYSPRELILRWRLDYKKHCRVLPETYCEVHDEPVPTNTMAWRTHECIALGPTGNLQGSVKFYCLTTGRVLKQ